tara:strand:- start:278 stop:520 length:243 start_codon:yes stop_codon:yes gene_type:complete
MKKIITERFQQLAGIKSLHEQEELPPEYTELTDEEKDFVDDILEEVYKKINPTNDMKKYTGFFKYIEAWFEAKGGIGSGD